MIKQKWKYVAQFYVFVCEDGEAWIEPLRRLVVQHCMLGCLDFIGELGQKYDLLADNLTIGM